MSIIDLTYLNEVSDGDEQLKRELIDIVVGQLPEFYDLMQSSLAQKQWDELASVAHKAKSSIASIGMQDLAVAMKRLEMLGKSFYLEKADENDRHVADYQRQINTLPEDLAAWLSENKTPEAAEGLINFYKLQTDLAISELVEHP